MYVIMDGLPFDTRTNDERWWERKMSYFNVKSHNECSGAEDVMMRKNQKGNPHSLGPVSSAILTRVWSMIINLSLTTRFNDISHHLFAAHAAHHWRMTTVLQLFRDAIILNSNSDKKWKIKIKKPFSIQFAAIMIIIINNDHIKFIFYSLFEWWAVV